MGTLKVYVDTYFGYTLLLKDSRFQTSKRQAGRKLISVIGRFGRIFLRAGIFMSVQFIIIWVGVMGWGQYL